MHGHGHVGIVASVALDAERDLNLRILDAGHLFRVNVTRLGLRQGAWLRGYALQLHRAVRPHNAREPEPAHTHSEAALDLAFLASPFSSFSTSPLSFLSRDSSSRNSFNSTLWICSNFSATLV